MGVDSGQRATFATIVVGEGVEVGMLDRRAINVALSRSVRERRRRGGGAENSGVWMSAEIMDGMGFGCG
jgi:hypothetical protein